MGSIVGVFSALVLFLWMLMPNADAGCVRLISPFENRPVVDQAEFDVTIKTLLKGRLDHRDLRFEYGVSPLATMGIHIAVFSKSKNRGALGHIEISAASAQGVPKVIFVEINEHYRGTGLAKVLYLIGAKLAFEKYRKPLSGDGHIYDYKTEWIWGSFVKQGYATWGDGYGQFQFQFLESSRTEELMTFFFANALERPVQYFFGQLVSPQYSSVLASLRHH